MCVVQVKMQDVKNTATIKAYPKEKKKKKTYQRHGNNKHVRTEQVVTVTDDLFIHVHK